MYDDLSIDELQIKILADIHEHIGPKVDGLEWLLSVEDILWGLARIRSVDLNRYTKLAKEIIQWLCDDASQAGATGKLHKTITGLAEVLLKNKPQIKIVGGLQPDILDQVEEVLAKSPYPLFQRGGMLVTVKMVVGKDTRGDPVYTPVILPVTANGLRTEMTRYIQWTQFKGKNQVTVDAPMDYAHALMAPDRHCKTLPQLNGILTAPTIRQDGTILAEPGFDDTTGLYLLDTGWGAIDVPDKPTKADAQRALGILKEVLTGIEFSNDAGADSPNQSRSVQLSKMISPIVQSLIGKVPGHLTQAGQYGSGKTYSDELMYNILRGMNVPVTNCDVDNDELTKVIDAHIFKGSPVICLDNATNVVGNKKLVQILTQDVIETRVLGLSKTIEVADYRAVVLINGSNFRVAKDFLRRTVLMVLRPSTPRPELRNFSVDYRLVIRRNRGRYIAAILTVILAYIEAGMPDILVPKLASFERWSDYVRSALVWLGEGDALGSMEDIRAEDPERMAISDFINGIHYEWPSSDELPIRFSINKLLSSMAPFDGKSDLYQAMLSVSRIKNGSIDPGSFGNWLSDGKDKPVDGWVIVREYRDPESKTKVARRWYVCKFEIAGNIQDKPYRGPFVDADVQVCASHIYEQKDGKTDYAQQEARRKETEEYEETQRQKSNMH